MDLERLEQSARLFVGEHDFLSFAATDPDLASRQSWAASGDGPQVEPAVGRSGRRRGAIRTIFSSSWEERNTESGGLLIYRVRGNGFLHHMVRNLVGTMLDVGRGYTAVEEIPAILAARARASAGPTAPAQGLFLHSVEYAEGLRDQGLRGLGT
jgi:tRNA pseudouridine38-40 synthase